MTVGDILHAVRRAWLTVLACTLIGAAAMFGVSKLSTPTYTASARVFVSVAASRGASDLSQGATFVQSQVASYADLATSPYVLDPVAKRLGIAGGAKGLSGRVTGSSSKETVLIDIKATDPEAQRSSTIADAIADELGTAVRQLAPRDADGRPMVQVVTVSRSGPPSAPQSPKTSRNTLTGGASGLLIGVLLACLWGFYRSKGNPGSVTDVPPADAIPAAEPPSTGKKQTWRKRKSPASASTPADADGAPGKKGKNSRAVEQPPATRASAEENAPADAPDPAGEKTAENSPPEQPVAGDQQTEASQKNDRSSAAIKRAAQVSLPTQPMASARPAATGPVTARDDDAQISKADRFRIPAVRRPSSKVSSTDEPTVYIPPVPRAVEPSSLKEPGHRTSAEGESRDG
ncbi:Capsular polysaccharide biosynthesis protein [Austwickia chelonae]|uniref:Polysaccharide chain length determinant N-terminal domain-containing protein n=1 Tax=Austwickia chelonae NBRC 105200 TaxID=1184607 RepID=K6WB40_9MICO|nr:Wzz/FepE/Etk N-terminal domain-containing protein [Austwickia chelonae]GAB79027.1 hypothetical protein AUCHE_18_00280 [Austwickia chelonae NBRC 105200]SEW41719.1 Capsular polysaccharide biosynthesis protein [Austwickia chelonae]